MPAKTKKTTAGTRKKTFSIRADDAKKVFLAGDFNHWNLSSHPMKLDRDGIWKKILMLPPGRYEYKFRVDDQWQTDPDNPQQCCNTFGTRNHVIIITP
ncbi:MAG: glycogen-binding domain-containing protein [Desulfatirhabdiaceae bacterium]